MSSSVPNPGDVKMLPPAGSAGQASISSAAQPLRQLSELPRDELEHLAEEYGLDPTRYRTRQHLVVAIHERRQVIAAMDRDAMLDVVRWGRRPVAANASKEQLAMEIARCKSMRFAGLSHRGLLVLARLRDCRIRGDEDVPALVRRLRKREGFFTRLNRKRRAMIGSIVSSIIGEEESAADYKFLPPSPGQGSGGAGAGSRSGTIKEEIEDAGLFGGLTARIKKTADSYLNQKLDEVEARIDRKLDEIDRRLAEWRDKEVANRIRILKITLWASVIVSVVSLIYTYVQVYIVPR